MRKVAVFAVLFAATSVAAGFGSTAIAQDTPRVLSDAELVGSPEAGRAFAQMNCGTCHAVGPGEGPSPNETAPTFQAVADTPGMTSRALTVWLTTFHPARTMPPIVLTDDERQNIIAYILSIAEN
ncbi:MAG: cytochrome c [Pseudomonadota bacterium]